MSILVSNGDHQDYIVYQLILSVNEHSKISNILIILESITSLWPTMVSWGHDHYPDHWSKSLYYMLEWELSIHFNEWIDYPIEWNFCQLMGKNRHKTKRIIDRSVEPKVDWHSLDSKSVPYVRYLVIGIHFTNESSFEWFGHKFGTNFFRQVMDRLLV